MDRTPEGRLLQRLREACPGAMTEQYCHRAVGKVEADVYLWRKLFHKRISKFRAMQRTGHGTGRGKDRFRPDVVALGEFIKQGIQFYTALSNTLLHEYARYEGGRFEVSTMKKLPKTTVARCFGYIGDLHRYWGELGGCGSDVEAEAQLFYEQANIMLPSQGYALNQIGVLKIKRRDWSAALLFIMRSACCADPFPGSKKNLEYIRAESRAVSQATREQAMKSTDSLAAHAVYLITSLYLNDEVTSQGDIEETLAALVQNATVGEMVKCRNPSSLMAEKLELQDTVRHIYMTLSLMELGCKGYRIDPSILIAFSLSIICSSVQSTLCFSDDHDLRRVCYLDTVVLISAQRTQNPKADLAVASALQSLLDAIGQVPAVALPIDVVLPEMIEMNNAANEGNPAAPCYVRMSANSEHDSDTLLDTVRVHTISKRLEQGG